MNSQAHFPNRNVLSKPALARANITALVVTTPNGGKGRSKFQNTRFGLIPVLSVVLFPKAVVRLQRPFHHTIGVVESHERHHRPVHRRTPGVN